MVSVWNECFIELFFRITFFSDGLWSVEGYLLRLTCHSLANWGKPSTDVMFVNLIINKTSKGLFFVLHVVIMASILKIVAKQISKRVMRKNLDNQNTVTEIWINDECQENHFCIYGLYHGWSFMVTI